LVAFLNLMNYTKSLASAAAFAGFIGRRGGKFYRAGKAWCVA